MEDSQNRNGFTAGILAGITAGLLLPKLVKEAVKWSQTTAGKKTLDEWIPQEDQRQITSMWNQRKDLWNEGVIGLKKRLPHFASSVEKTVQDTVEEVVEAVKSPKKPRAKRTPVASVAKKKKKTTRQE